MNKLKKMPKFKNEDKHLKQLANKRDVPYQTLLKMCLAERIERELHAA